MGLVVRQPDLLDIAQANAIAVRGAELATAARARGPVDRWHNVGAAGEPGWGDAAFANYGQGYNPVGFSREPSGFVTLRGLLAVTGGANFTADRVVFTLPAGYRPAYTESPTAAGVGQVNVNPNGTTVLATTKVAFRLRISPDGTVLGGMGVTDWVTLDGIRFRIPS